MNNAIQKRVRMTREEKILFWLAMLLAVIIVIHSIRIVFTPIGIEPQALANGGGARLQRIEERLKRVEERIFSGENR